MLSLTAGIGACGGLVEGGPATTDTTPASSDTTDIPHLRIPPHRPAPTGTTTSTPPKPPTPTTTTLPTWTTCGDAGDRLKDEFCADAKRQVPCEIAETADAGSQPLLDEDTCERFCWNPGDRCSTHFDDEWPHCKQVSHVSCGVNRQPNGTMWLQCFDECPGGRRPDGYGGCPAEAASPLARLFERLAQLETVSIGAFGALADDLERHGAPASLVDRALVARKDEVRHARATWRLARRFGARPTRLTMPRPTPKSVLELALENAAEGCVREAYGAIVARYQSARAQDPEIAAVMTEIAADEAEHAELAWSMHDFFLERLDDHGRAAVMSVLEEAIADLSHDVALAEHAPEVEARAGLPSRTAAFAGLAALRAHVRERAYSKAA